MATAPVEIPTTAVATSVPTVEETPVTTVGMPRTGQPSDSPLLGLAALGLFMAGSGWLVLRRKPRAW